VHGAASSQLVIRNELTPFLAAANDAVFAHQITPPSVASQLYELRHRTHNRSLPDRAGHLSYADFISQMTFKDTYLFQANSIFYYLSYLLYR